MAQNYHVERVLLMESWGVAVQAAIVDNAGLKVKL